MPRILRLSFQTQEETRLSGIMGFDIGGRVCLQTKGPYSPTSHKPQVAVNPTEISTTILLHDTVNPRATCLSNKQCTPALDPNCVLNKLLVLQKRSLVQGLCWF